ncbi:hypothetical protein [Ruegeria jejuensis]|uniref:hypothetical protein n=1 Tax=Ruegeria jejuensis TaxID=3233338 RepID=UPI00355C4DAA
MFLIVLIFAFFAYVDYQDGGSFSVMSVFFVLVSVGAIHHLYRTFKQPDLFASVSNSGVALTRHYGGTLTNSPVFPWNKLNAIEIREGHRKWWPGRRYRVLRLIVGNIYFEFPLKRMSPILSDQFVEALRQHWPDLDQPWQEQAKARNRLDSGAG